MANLKIRHFCTETNRDGTRRHYWRPSAVLRKAGWKTVRLDDDRHKAIAQCEGINRHVDEWRAGLQDKPATALPGSVHALIGDYKNSADYTGLRKKTQKDYGYTLETIREWCGDAPASAVTQSAVQEFYDTVAAKHPRKAMMIIQVMRVLFGTPAARRQLAGAPNPAVGIRMKYKAAKGRLWSADAVAHFVATADRMGHHSHGTAVMLNEWIGQRRGDILALRMDQYEDGALHLVQSKTGAEVEGLAIDEVPALKARIDAQIARNRARGKNTKGREKCSAFLIQQEAGRQEGKGFEESYFRRIFEDIRAEAAISMPAIADLVFKDLRHTAVTRLAENDATTIEIASVTGHSLKTCEDIIDRYNVRTKKMARNALIKRKEGTKG